MYRERAEYDRRDDLFRSIVASARIDPTGATRRRPVKALYFR